MEALLIISTFGALAKSVMELWNTHSASRDSALLRDHQMRIELAREAHEVAMERLRKGTLPTQDVPDNEYFRRLGAEAALLSSFPVKVIFEPIGDGYGVALPISKGLTIALWLSPLFPKEPPMTILQSGNEINMIEFSPGAWEPNLSLLDVVTAVCGDAINDYHTKTAEAGSQ